MGKVKQFLRSLSRRLSIPIFKARGESVASRESSVFSSLAQNDTDSKSVSTTDTRATSNNEARTAPSTPSIAPTDPACPETVALTGASIDGVPGNNAVKKPPADLNAWVELKVNIAILRFVNKLPLDELRIIGQRLTLSSSSTEAHASVEDEACPARSIPLESFTQPKTVSLGSTTRELSEVFPRGPDNRIERNSTRDDHERNQYAMNERLSLCSSELGIESHGDAVTLSLTSQGSDLACSFACQSAQRVERDHTQRQREAANMERAPSFTTRSADSCDLFLESIGLSIHPGSIPRTDHDDMDEFDMDEFDMDNLPNWSDVEDDPEYNQFEERSFHWTDTDSSHSSRKSMRMADTSSPAFYVAAVDVDTIAPSMQGDVAHSNHG